MRQVEEALLNSESRQIMFTVRRQEQEEEFLVSKLSDSVQKGVAAKTSSKTQSKDQFSKNYFKTIDK